MILNRFKINDVVFELEKGTDRYKLFYYSQSDTRYWVQHHDRPTLRIPAGTLMFPKTSGNQAYQDSVKRWLEKQIKEFFQEPEMTTFDESDMSNDAMVSRIKLSD